MERETAVEIRATCLRVHAVTTDGKHLAGLSGQLPVGAVVGRSVGETDDDSELLRRCSAVIELTVPFRLNGNDVFIICLQKVVVERPVLLEEIMETCVRIELVETLDEVVEVNVLPASGEFVAIADKLHLALLCFQMNRHIRHPIVGDAVFGTQLFVVGDGRMLSVLCKPGFGVFGILTGKVVAEFLKSRRAREDAHQLYGLRHF